MISTKNVRKTRFRHHSKLGMGLRRSRPMSQEASETRKFIGGKLKDARKAKGLSQADLAEKVGGVPETLSNIERGIYSASLDKLIKITNVLGISLAEVMPPTKIESEKDAVLAELIMAAQDLDQTTLKIALAQIKALKPER